MIYRLSTSAQAGTPSVRFAESPFDDQPRNHAADESTKRKRFERVLVPVDLSTNALAVLRRARELACTGSIIRVLHTVQLNIVGEERGIAQTGLIRELRDTARAELGKLLQHLWANETPAAVIVREGCPKDVILQEAHLNDADLIVMGARPHAGWRRLFHRNTASHVIRAAPCPVLVVRI